MSIALRFMKLFAGFTGAYGTYATEDKNLSKGGKLEIKSTAKTIREMVSEELWDLHLRGVHPLGIIPIDENNTARWGCIDVDKYDVNHAALADSISKHGFPLIVCKSKSGGAHIFIFLRSPVPASDLQASLRAMASRLGVGDSEIFPKQSKVLLDRGDLGNWLNMPYFGDKGRHGIKKTGAAMELEEFLSLAERTLVQGGDLEILQTPQEGQDQSLDDGPPCLQHLSAAGFPEGTRNNGLFALGVFCKKKFGLKWKEVLEDYNRQFMIPPLPAEEVQAVTKALEKKEYNYRCTDVPLVNHCNSALCRTRKFGVGDPGQVPVITGLSVLDTDPPLWFMDIDGDHRIEMGTDDLQQYKRFHKICMEQLLICYRSIGQEAWLKMLSGAMQNVTRIEAPPEVGLQGHFQELLEDFLTNKQKGERLEDMLSGRPWEDQEVKKHYFRLKDLQLHMERSGLRGLTRGQITQRIRDMGGAHSYFNIKGKGMNVWWVASSKVVPLPRVEPPEIKDAPI